MPGLTQVPIHDCVVASCSLPGIFPPKKINRFFFVDGSTMDTLPIKVAVYHKVDLIVAVYLESIDPSGHGAQPPTGIVDVLMQAQSVNSRTLFEHDLRHFQGEPVVLVSPKVYGRGMFQFDEIAALIAEGERAAHQAFRSHPLLADLVPPTVVPASVREMNQPG
jgi:NTE family protein